jgi:hypothetical protein
MTEIIGSSKFKPDNGAGQNGSALPSSVPAKPQLNLINPAAQAVRVKDPVLTDADVQNFQTRAVKSEQYPTTFGHRDRNVNPAKVPANSRPVFQRPLNSTFKRGR